MESLFLTVEDAAKQLGLSKHTVYIHIRNKEIPSAKVGKKFLIPRQYITDLIANCVRRTEPVSE